MASLIDAVGSATLLLFAGSAALAFVIALVATPIVGRVATRLRLLDRPGGRRQHARPIPRIGGVGNAPAFRAAPPSFLVVAPLHGHTVPIPPTVGTPQVTRTVRGAV